MYQLWRCLSCSEKWPHLECNVVASWQFVTGLNLGDLVYIITLSEDWYRGPKSVLQEQYCDTVLWPSPGNLCSRQHRTPNHYMALCLCMFRATSSSYIIRTQCLSRYHTPIQGLRNPLGFTKATCYCLAQNCPQCSSPTSSICEKNWMWFVAPWVYEQFSQAHFVGISHCTQLILRQPWLFWFLRYQVSLDGLSEGAIPAHLWPWSITKMKFLETKTIPSLYIRTWLIQAHRFHKMKQDSVAVIVSLQFETQFNFF